jgi:transcriptional regulator with XRE-family HTH domain
MSTQPQFGHIPERTVGRRLRDAREDTGMSQAQFAQATGIAQRTVSRYEQASDASGMKRPNLLAWSFATGVPVIWLETGVTPPRPPDWKETGYKSGRTGHLASMEDYVTAA